MRIFRLTFGLLFCIAIGASAAAGQTSTRVALDYRISIASLEKQTYRVEVRVAGATEPEVELRMPSWQPASYALQPYAKAVGAVTARSARGARLVATHPNRNAWRVRTAGAAAFTFAYTLDVSERQKLYSRSYLYPTIGAIQAGGALLYLPAHRDAPVRVALDLPADWQVATALDGGPRDFRAVDYDELVDSPLVFGDLVRRDFTVRGIPFSAVLDARIPIDVDALEQSLARIADVEIAFFGDAPFDRYLFLYVLTPDPSGNGEFSTAVGIEHLKSTLITVSPYLTTLPDSFRLVLDEANAHELFHAWNVKAIHPEQLARPDYAAAPRVRSLWLLEGVTSYYTHRLMAAAQIDDDIAPSLLRVQLGSALQSSASRDRSVEQIAYDLPENGLDPMIAVYVRGEALGLLLDLKIRLGTDNRVGLDDVVRALYRRSERGKQSYREADLPDLFSRTAGVDLTDFFRRHIAGGENYPIGDLTAAAGFSLDSPPKSHLRLSSQADLSTLQQQIQTSILNIKGHR